MKQKILILYTAIGMGHKSMAENIGYHLQNFGYEVRLENVLKVQSGKLVDRSTAVHQFINKYVPGIWAFLYFWGHWVLYPFRLTIAKHNYQNVLQMINEYHPDLVISVHTTASGVITYLRKHGLYKGKFAIGFSDYHLHPYWVYKEADIFLANIVEQKEELVKKYGIAPERIFVNGMSLKPALKVDSAAVKQRLGIEPNEKVVLMAGGSQGIGLKIDELYEVVKIPNTKLVFVCGKNTTLFGKLTKENIPHTKVLGFYTPMQELYAISDIFVTKPGGLTVAESLQMNLPMVVTFTLPGQEDINYKYLLARNLILPKPKNLAASIEEEISWGKFRKQLATNPYVAKIIGNPDVLAQAAKTVLG